MVKYSRQREAIVNYLKGTKEHPSAETVYQNIRLTYPSISLGTVYRNLSLLEENGQLLRIPMENGCDRFDADTSQHYHFSCRSCGCLSDIPMSPITSLDQLAEAHFDGLVEGHTLIFHGLCGKCRNSEK